MYLQTRQLGVREVDLVPIGYYQVGTVVYYRLSNTYMRNGLWSITSVNLDVEHKVLQTGNTITVDCVPVMTNANQVSIRYVNADTGTVITGAAPAPEYVGVQQKGSIYEYTVPEIITVRSKFLLCCKWYKPNCTYCRQHSKSSNRCFI